ncbi:hypothetical protein ACOJA0_03325 [Corynebacterium amycolatum]|uniref:hypothetical protein n=1 Tax=Corynebacterium TaxID=1716 RepID=UPI0008A64D11|nr:MULTISPECIES: hypothetical protein [unclassified Corynebacterium]MBC6767331.1 hypothetical protein [Corynebacterium sp. LK15]OFL73747.1 hypothetical protein HMPREF2752_00455 [Corynebacterium sp. HMSC077C02]OFR60506.1 hypothetical protein HMPREF2878_07440 [Corynebacterium sp. HMSC065H09]OHR25531.1 hypothetical protein HMPREF2899_04535 [Corynebacterium sp. HMSC072D01]TXS79399.1 hypothetical protein CHU72_08515 [Corynebacterium sp. LK12]
MALEKFHHEFDGKKFTLPKFDQLPFGVIRKLRKLPDEEQFFQMFELAADDKALAVIDTMGMKDIEKLVEDWQKDAGVTQGES